MGACNFNTRAKGKTAREAYETAVREAQYEYGHDPYNGTISTTGGFKMFRTTIGPVTEEEFQRGWGTSHKWEECWCAQSKPGEFTFWGWAAE
jgi:hypothetical protein